MILSISWQMKFTGPDRYLNSLFSEAIYASFSFPLFLIGLTPILMLGLVGKASAFRWWFCSQTWTMLSQQAVGYFYTIPWFCIYLFVGTPKPIAVTYPQFMSFSAALYFQSSLLWFICSYVDRPFYALLSIAQDYEDAKSGDYNL